MITWNYTNVLHIKGKRLEKVSYSSRVNILKYPSAM